MEFGRKIRNWMMGALIGGFFFTMPINVYGAEGDVAIDEATFPDDIFRNYVLLNCDTNGDGFLSDEEIDSVRSINVNEKGIESLSGVEFFTSLTHLSCYVNNLTDLDVSKNTTLEYLSCYNNNLSSLDVSKNTALKHLSCGENSLTNLDVSKNTALEYLSCYSNNLTSLDVSKNIALESLSCYKNNLPSLDVSKNTALTDLLCNHNNLTSLDVSKNTALTRLYCDNNNLTSLDLSKNTELTYLYCPFNSLTSLDVSKNTALVYLFCFNNNLPSLDVSGDTALKQLKCEVNNLTSLDVSKNTALTTLDCSNNSLTYLDVSKNTVLTELHCINNNLPSLDVSKNTALTHLYCYINNLPSLDVSKNTVLTHLRCDRNNLLSLDLSNNSILVDVLKNGSVTFDDGDIIEYTYGDAVICTDQKTQLLTEEVAPVAPVNLSAAVANGQVTLNWDVSVGATKYAVYRKTGNDSWEKLSSSITDIAYVDKTASAGKKYAYYVKAFYQAGWSSASSIARVSIPLDAPKTVEATAEEGKVTVEWSKVDGAEKYGLYRRMNERNAEGNWVLVSDALTNLKYVDTAVVANTEYQYRVSAYSEAGWGVFGTSEKVKIPIRVMIDESNFPDDIFRNYVLLNYDTDGDGLLSGEEIDNVIYINVEDKGIEFLSGVEFFTSLDHLVCSHNSLTNLDVSKNTALTWLDCSHNSLTDLDTSKNTALKTLYCTNNNLTRLDVSKNTALTSLSCSGNNLASLDVSKNTALTNLLCNDNNLLSLDVSKNTVLMYLSCGTNNLKNLDVSKNTALVSLSCECNNLTNLDVSKNTTLEYLQCDANNLTSMDVGKNTALTVLRCADNDLASLDVSKNTALTDLNCASNNLSSLDVSKHTALTRLECFYNNLPSLDLSNNTPLADAVKNGSVSFWGDGITYTYGDVEIWADQKTKLLTEAAVPAAPKNVIATHENGQVTLKWDASAGATKYAVYRKTGSGSWETLSNSITKTSYVDKTAAAGKKYAYYVKAYKEGKWSDSSSYAKVSIPLGAPKTVAVSPAEGKVTVAWSKVEGAGKYGLYRRMNKGDAWSSWALISDTMTNSKYVDTAVTANTEYQYRVRAYSEAGWSGFKVSEKVKPLGTVPVAPESIKAVTYTGKVSLSWSKVDGAKKYRLDRRVQQSGSWTDWETLSTQTATSNADKTVTSGKVYQYRVSAYNDAGWGDFTVSQNISYGAMAPETIKMVGYTGKVSVSWSAVAGATKYCLYRRVYNGSSWGTWQAVVTKSATSYADKDVTAGTKYQYRVRAYNASGWSGFTVSSAVKPK